LCFARTVLRGFKYSGLIVVHDRMGANNFTLCQDFWFAIGVTCIFLH